MIKPSIFKRNAGLRVITLYLIITVFSGCGIDMSYISAPPGQSGNPDTEGTGIPAKSPEARHDNVLNLSMRFPKTLNPLLNEDKYVADILKLVFEPLIIINERGNIVPNLAESYEVMDGLNLKITLKDGLVWHDGAKITADDIVFSVNTLKSAPETVVYKNAVSNIASCSAVDSRTVSITYRERNSFSIYNLSFPVIPKKYYEKNMDKHGLTPVGNGAYEFSSLDTSLMKLVKNENYFKGAPLIPNVNVTISPDINTDYYLFDQGLTDVVSMDIYDWGKHRSEKQADVLEFSIPYFDFIGFNFKREVFNNLNIRKAVAHLTPNSALVETVYINHAGEAETPIGRQSFLYTEDTQSYPYDINSAKGFVSKSGYAKEVLTVSIIVNEENEERVKIAGVLESGLNEAGFTASVFALPFEEYEKRLISGEFDLFVGGFVLSNTPDLTPVFHSLSTSTQGGLNYMNYNSPDMDILLLQAKNAVGEAELKREMAELQKKIAADLPLIGIAFRKSTLITDKKIKGEKKIAPDYLFLNVNEWYVE